MKENQTTGYLTIVLINELASDLTNDINFSHHSMIIQYVDIDSFKPQEAILSLVGIEQDKSLFMGISQ